MKTIPPLMRLIRLLPLVALTIFAANALAAAPTISIKASSNSITSGQTATLTVTVASAASVHVTGSNGTSYTLPYNGGTLTVAPTATTTYTAVATNSSGSASAQTTITVSGSGGGGSGSNPVVSMTASSTNITAGQSVTLTVTASRSASVKVTGSNGTSYSLPYNGGTLTVSPTSTTTYTATSTNSSGSTSTQVTITVGSSPQNPTVSITAQNSSISSGSSDVLTVTASNATSVTVTGSDGSSYPLSSTGGQVTVTPTTTTTYTAEASNASGVNASAQTTVTVSSSSGGGDVSKAQHVIFMLQENRSFDSYFGMLNNYRHPRGWDIGDDGKTYTVDGIEDKVNTTYNMDDEGDKYYLYKFRTTCIDDDSSDWLASYGSVNRYNFSTTRPINMDGFVHTAEGYAKSCVASGTCGGAYTDTTGERAMGYYDDQYLNYYYYMASQFAVSDRWFSPISSKSVPNRIATFSGGTTQGLAYDPGNDDHVGQQTSQTIFQELNNAGVSWKIYYSKTSNNYPDTIFSYFGYANQFLYHKTSTNSCTNGAQPSSVVGDSTNSFCINTSHIAPVSQYFTDLANNTLPAFAFIEAGNSDEHPGSQQPVTNGQASVANIINKFMASSSWQNSVFFFSYDEGGGPYDHVPPVPGHSNQNTDASLGSIPDISSIAVNPDGYNPCVPPTPGQYTQHCDLRTSSPGAHSGDAAQVYGFAAQLGFRVPNMIISPFTRKHYVSHTPMDHTAVIKFVESRFINSSAHLTNRDAAQPNLLEFFDFNAVPWATPPTPPAPSTASACSASSMGP
ncbi:alkaline phosphatase family protein [Occallatibacter savannae]|uniref:alkaline phosphatase family protein n=1 Tax=Occallatibacter savannae TaxID=1002691 RepID=UPI001EF65B34|nr:alkaline phosphatase family protein [Occallatibacter savannae]